MKLSNLNYTCACRYIFETKYLTLTVNILFVVFDHLPPVQSVILLKLLLVKYQRISFLDIFCERIISFSVHLYQDA